MKLSDLDNVKDMLEIRDDIIRTINGLKELQKSKGISVIFGGGEVFLQHTEVDALFKRLEESKESAEKTLKDLGVEVDE